jgi:hypothetical protein
MIPSYSLDELREIYFQICWQHYGIGLSMTPSDLDDLEIDDILWYLGRVKRAREKR